MQITLVLDLGSQLLRVSRFNDQPLTQLLMKRGDSTSIRLWVVGGTLAPEASLRFVLKPLGRYDAAVAAQASEWTHHAGDFWTAPLNLLTVQMDELLRVDDNPDNDLPSVQLMAEMAWRATELTPWRRSQTVNVVCENNIWRGAELAPALIDTEGWEWLKARLVGGTVNEALHTIDISAPTNLGGLRLELGSDGKVLVYSGLTSLGYLQIFES